MPAGVVEQQHDALVGTGPDLAGEGVEQGGEERLGQAVGQVPGVTSPFAQNCTLSGAQGERFGNGTERSQSVSGAAGVPVVITGERDMLPSEWRDMARTNESAS